MDVLALVSKFSSLREVSKWRHSKDVKKIRRDKAFPENRTLRGAMRKEGGGRWKDLHITCWHQRRKAVGFRTALPP